LQVVSATELKKQGLPVDAELREAHRIVFELEDIRANFEMLLDNPKESLGRLQADFPNFHEIVQDRARELGIVSPITPQPTPTPPEPAITAIEPVIPQAPEVPDQVIPAVATPDVPHIKDIGILEKVRPTRKVFRHCQGSDIR